MSFWRGGLWGNAFKGRRQPARRFVFLTCWGRAEAGTPLAGLPVTAAAGGGMRVWRHAAVRARLRGLGRIACEPARRSWRRALRAGGPFHRRDDRADLHEGPWAPRVPPCPVGDEPRFRQSRWRFSGRISYARGSDLSIRAPPWQSLLPASFRNCSAAAAPDATRQAAIAVMSRVPDTTYRAAMQALVRFDERASLGQIDIPCLLLAGEDDRSAPPRVMQRMAEKMNNARVETVAGMGHLGNMEMPDAYNRIVSEFLQGGPP